MEPNTITPEMAERILDADYRNIVKKVADGKPLTSSEMARIQARAAGAIDSSVTFAKTTTELGGILGVPRQTLNRWKKKPGAPQPKPNGFHSVVEWREFMRLRDLKAGRGGAPDEEALRARKLLAEVEEKEIKTSVLKGEYVQLELVRQEWTANVGKARALLEARLLNELPPLLSGMDAVSIREELDKVIYEFYSTLHTGGACTP